MLTAGKMIFSLLFSRIIFFAGDFQRYVTPNGLV